MKTIETERLILRGWRLDDLDDFFDYAKNPDTGVMQGWKPHLNKEETLYALKSYIKDDDRWAIALKENNNVIGSVRLYPDENRGKYYAKYINYVLFSNYWNNGYMTEAVKRVIKYAFDEVNVDLLSAFHYPHNIRSKRVIEKCGFQYEVTIKQGNRIYDGQIFDTVCYYILKSEYYSE